MHTCIKGINILKVFVFICLNGWSWMRIKRITKEALGGSLVEKISQKIKDVHTIETKIG